MRPESQFEISVIVPTHDREPLLRRCLDALVRQTLSPESFEVIVIDDGSSDGTPAFLESVATRFSRRSLRLEGVGAATARDAGIGHARGRICLFLDDDVVAERDCLAAHVAAHGSEERVVGIGALSQQPPSGRDWYAEAFARGWNAHYARLEERPAAWSDCYAGNLSVSRAALLAAGGYSADGELGKDVELGFRLQRSGFSLRYIPGARAVHDDQKGRRGLLEDLRRHGATYPRLAELPPEMAPKLLGWFNAATPREVALRRLLIALRAPPGAIAALGAAMGPDRQEFWYGVVWRFAFWRSVRKQLSRAHWRELTRRLPSEGAAAVGAEGLS